HRIQIVGVPRMAAKFRKTGRKLLERPDQSVHSNELRQTRSGVILSVKATVITNVRGITSQRDIQLPRHVQKDRFESAATMNVLMRVQVCRVGAGQAAELGKLAPR